MSSNCLISFFACCNSRKRTIVPSDSSVFTNIFQNQSVSTQTPLVISHNLLKSGSLPMLKTPASSSHKPIIMIKQGSQFVGRSSDEFTRQKERNCTKSPARRENKPESLQKEKQRQGSLPRAFVMEKGKNMPRLFPVTPRSYSKSGLKLPNITKNRNAAMISEEFDHIENDGNASLVNYE